MARAAAGRVRAAASEAIARAGAFRLALSGGRTPGLLYRLLGAELTLPWERIEILFADERAVPPDHSDSNWRLVSETLLAPLGARAPVARRMRGEAADLDAAAREYEAHLGDPVDLLILGIGEDGHTASLFPGSPLVEEGSIRVGVVRDSPKPPPRRLTITPRVIGEAREVLTLATGAEKSAAVARALAPEGNARTCPARLARRGAWMLDLAAAGLG